MKHFLRLLCLLLTLGSLHAQAPAGSEAPAAAPAASATAVAPGSAEAPAKQKAKALFDLVKQGGVTFYFLIALSIIMVALIIFFLLTIRRGAVVSDYFMQAADSLIRKQDYLGLLGVCNRRNEAIASITQKALDFATKNPMATFDEVREVTQAEGQRQAGQLHQRVTYLSDVASVAPMIGLLGTVIGLMSEFTRISKADMQQAQMEFAGGTAEALINTAAGLVIAIPAMMIASLYRGKVNGLISELESASTHIMALLGSQYKRVTAARAAQSAAQPARRA